MLKFVTYTPEQRRDYDSYIDNMVSLQAVVESALYRGRYEGRAQGRKEGFEQGKEQEKWITARNLINLGVDISTISKGTGLSEEDLRRELLS